MPSMLLPLRSTSLWATAWARHIPVRPCADLRQPGSLHRRPPRRRDRRHRLVHAVGELGRVDLALPLLQSRDRRVRHHRRAPPAVAAADRVAERAHRRAPPPEHERGLGGLGGLLDILRRTREDLRADGLPPQLAALRVRVGRDVGGVGGGLGLAGAARHRNDELFVTRWSLLALLLAKLCPQVRVHAAALRRT